MFLTVNLIFLIYIPSIKGNFFHLFLELKLFIVENIEVLPPHLSDFSS